MRTRALLLVVLASVALSTPAAGQEDDNNPPHGDHWVLPRVYPIAATRMDPIVKLGGISGHLHNILGASNFRSVLNTPEEQQRAECSSTTVQDDKSSYWTPQLYYINPNGTFSAMSMLSRIYYFHSSPNNQAFPPGLRMVSGLATHRDMNAIQSQGLQFITGTGFSYYLPNGTSHPTAPEYIKLAIRFPSCGWAN